MKRSIIYTRLALSVTAFLFGMGAFAQTPTPAPAPKAHAEKKVIITVIDENGKTETRTFNGDELNNAQLPEEARGALDMARQMQINVDVQEGQGDQPRVRIKRIAPNGEANEFEWNGAGPLPKEFEGQMQILRENLEGLGNIHINVEGLEELQRLEELGNFDIDIELPEMPEMPEMPGFNWGCMGKMPVGCNGNMQVLIDEPNGGAPKAQLGVMLDIDVKSVNGTETRTITVSEVVPGSAAEAAGLKAGDLITRVDGKEITETEGVVEAVRAKNPGDNMTVTYVRDGVENTVTATLKERKEEPMKQRRVMVFPRGMERFPECAQMAAERACEELEKLTGRPFLGVYVNGNDDAEQLVIQSIIEKTGAEEAGLKAADILLEVDGKDVKNYNDLCKAVQARKPGDKVRVKYDRAGKKNTIKATLTSRGQLHPEKVKSLQELCEQKDKVATPTPPPAPVEPVVAERPTVAPSVSDITNFSTYPNPSKGVFTLSFEGAAVPTTIMVSDLQGKEAFRSELNDFNGAFRGEIDLSSAAKGVYFLNISQNGKLFTEKIILN